MPRLEKTGSGGDGLLPQNCLVKLQCFFQLVLLMQLYRLFELLIHASEASIGSSVLKLSF